MDSEPQDYSGKYRQSLDSVKLLGKKYSLSSNRVISSSYWKVPDRRANLTSIACHDTDPLIAVASASRDSNIFIYEVSAPLASKDPDSEGDSSANNSGISRSKTSRKSFQGGISADPGKRRVHRRTVSEAIPHPKALDDDAQQQSKSTDYKKPISSNYARPLDRTPVLTHHQTISLGGIHSLAWVPSSHKLSEFGNVLATGHSGFVHMVMLPDPYENNGPAEILSRFNHTRHLSADSITSSRIRTLKIASSAWTCCPESAVISLFSEHLYLWDPSRSDTPIVKQRTRKARSFDVSSLRNGIVSFATDRGISIMDVRYKNPASLAPPNENDGMVSLVRWSPIDENRVASVHDQTLIKIWDIRGGSPLMTLDGHYDKINSIDWSLNNSDELFSASSDGTVRLWDLQKCSDSTVSSTNSTNSDQDIPLANSYSDPSSQDWLPSKSWRLYRQRLARENSAPSYNYFLDNIQNTDSPCTTIFSNKKEYLELSTVQLPLCFTGEYRHKSSRSKVTVPQMITIDNEGFFGLHSRIPTQHDNFEPMEQPQPVPKAAEASIASQVKQTMSAESTSSSAVATATAAVAAAAAAATTATAAVGTAASPIEILEGSKDPFTMGHVKRHSLESIASMTSKSANSDSDMNLDDSVSETSSSSGQASPVQLSPAPTNVQPLLAPTINPFSESNSPVSPTFGPSQILPKKKKHSKTRSVSSSVSSASTASSDNYHYTSCDPRASNSSSKHNRRHTMHYSDSKASLPALDTGFEPSLGTSTNNSTISFSRTSSILDYSTTVEPLKLSKPRTAPSSPHIGELSYKSSANASSVSMPIRSSRRTRSSYKPDVLAQLYEEEDPYASRDLPLLPPQKVRFSFPTGY